MGAWIETKRRMAMVSQLSEARRALMGAWIETKRAA